MGKGLTRQVLAAVEAGPTWVSRLARELRHRKWEIGTILKRLEARGLIYSRPYTWTGPEGEPYLLRAYFPAGLADGLPLRHLQHQPDLPTRQTAQALQQTRATIIEFAAESRRRSPRPEIRHRADKASPLMIWPTSKPDHP